MHLAVAHLDDEELSTLAFGQCGKLLVWEREERLRTEQPDLDPLTSCFFNRGVSDACTNPVGDKDQLSVICLECLVVDLIGFNRRVFPFGACC